MNGNSNMIRGTAIRAAGKYAVRGFSSLYVEGIGAPLQTVKYDTSASVTRVSQTEIGVTMKCSPITIEDSRRIRGLSMVSQSTGLGGTIGVGVVSTIGTNVTGLKPNDMVLVVGACWAHNITVSPGNLIKLPSLGVEEASMIPPLAAAWGILRSLPGLKKGDVIYQTNGASAVGDALTKLANVQSVSVVSLSDADVLDFKKFRNLPKANHAIVGTVNAKLVHNMSRGLLDNGGLLFYNAAHRENGDSALAISASASIFHNICLRGFDFTAWATRNRSEFTNAVTDISQLLADKKVTLSSSVYHLSEYRTAFEGVETTGAHSYFKF